MNSLMRKVSADGRIIQDTGTGGAYLCSTDRIIWGHAGSGNSTRLPATSLAAQQGNQHPAEIADDQSKTLHDPATGPLCAATASPGLASASNPTRWMQPYDIYQSENLGTNAVHYQANIVLAQMAAASSDPARRLLR
jgi:hypothetical protein